jgi:hypothetical protein
MDYTAQRHTVGLASRMEQIAEPGKVYVTAHTAAQVEGYFALADLGEMEIKGVHGAMHVYELSGLGRCALAWTFRGPEGSRASLDAATRCRCWSRRSHARAPAMRRWSAPWAKRVSARACSASNSLSAAGRAA